MRNFFDLELTLNRKTVQRNKTKRKTFPLTLKRSTVIIQRKNANNRVGVGGLTKKKRRHEKSH